MCKPRLTMAKLCFLLVTPILQSYSYLMAPTIRDFPRFDAAADARALRRAMKGWGVNEGSIISVLTKRSFHQRLEIVEEYQHQFKRSLESDLRSELSGMGETLLIDLLMEPSDFYAQEVHNAVAGLGTDESTLNDVFCCLRRGEASKVRQAFKKRYFKDLDKEIKEDVSGDYGRLLEALRTKERSSRLKPEFVQNAVTVLIRASKGTTRWFGTDEPAFIAVFAESSFEELKEISKQYHNATGILLNDSIKSETSSDFLHLLLQILHYAENPPKYYAQRINSALHGGYMKDLKVLNRVLVTRAEKDLKSISSMYGLLFERPLINDIQASSSKLFQKAAVSIVEGNVS